MPNKLNIPNKKDKFEAVPYVKDMSKFQLQVLVKNIVENLHELANVCDDSKADVSNVIDKILDQKLWNKKDIDDKFIYAPYEGYTIRFNTQSKAFTILNDKYEIIKTIEGKTILEIKADIKQARELAKKSK